MATAKSRPTSISALLFANGTPVTLKPMPVLAQIELWQHVGKYKNEVYVLPKHLDEKVAQLHLGRLDAHLTTLSDEQAAYIGVPTEGPYKPEHYRY